MNFIAAKEFYSYNLIWNKLLYFFIFSFAFFRAETVQPRLFWYNLGSY